MRCRAYNNRSCWTRTAAVLRAADEDVAIAKSVATKRCLQWTEKPDESYLTGRSAGAPALFSKRFQETSTNSLTTSVNLVASLLSMTLRIALYRSKRHKRNRDWPPRNIGQVPNNSPAARCHAI